MSLDKRISELEQRAGGGADEVGCIFLVAMQGEGERLQPVGYSTSGLFGVKRWDIGGGQMAEDLAARIAREAQSLGSGVVPLVCENYAEGAAA